MLSAEAQRDEVTRLLSQISEQQAEDTVNLTHIEHLVLLSSQLSDIIGNDITRAMIGEKLCGTEELLLCPNRQRH